MYCHVIPLLAFTVFLGLSRVADGVGVTGFQSASVAGNAEDA
jgi:hypothetical protein